MITDFDEDIQLQDWEAMLAKLRSADVDDLTKALKAAAWDEVRQYGSDEIPHFGNVYASVLLSNLQAELSQQLPDGAVEYEVFVNATNTSFSVDGVYINNFGDWVEFLAENTNLNQLYDLVSAIKYEYKHEDSKTLNALYFDGQTRTIINHHPTEEDLKSMGVDVDYQNMSHLFKTALGAALFIKAFIDEHREDDEAETSVKVDGLEVTLFHDGDFWSHGFIESLERIDACVTTQKVADERAHASSAFAQKP